MLLFNEYEIQFGRLLKFLDYEDTTELLIKNGISGKRYMYRCNKLNKL